ncbi:MAG TPA: hypothetical protein VI423_11350, partial [Paenisporosarcina sp.]|nr:hypothetical protein [Paenisporosarcina sp.]
DCSECMPANDSNHVHDDNCACGGDVMGMTAFNEMVDLLTKISTVQEELGLTKSSGVTLIALSTMIKELQKKAQFGDQNDAKVKDFMGGGIHTLTGPYTGKKDDPYVMTSEVDELDTKEEVEEAKKMMEAPRTYSALLKDPQLAALERRVQEMGEAPSQLEVSPEAITDLAPSPYIGGEGEDLGFSLPAPSRLAQRPLPGGASAPNTEEDLQVANLLEDIKYGEEGVDDPRDLVVTPGRDVTHGFQWMTYDPNAKLEEKDAFKKLDAWLKKQAEPLEPEDLGLLPDEDEDDEDEILNSLLKEEDVVGRHDESGGTSTPSDLEAMRDEEAMARLGEEGGDEEGDDEELDSILNKYEKEEEEEEEDFEDESEKEDLFNVDDLFGSDIDQEMESGDFFRVT